MMNGHIDQALAILFNAFKMIESRFCISQFMRNPFGSFCYPDKYYYINQLDIQFIELWHRLCIGFAQENSGKLRWKWRE